MGSWAQANIGFRLYGPEVPKGLGLRAQGVGWLGLGYQVPIPSLSRTGMSPRFKEAWACSTWIFSSYANLSVLHRLCWGKVVEVETLIPGVLLVGKP